MQLEFSLAHNQQMFVSKLAARLVIEFSIELLNLE